mgnify:CR=1 FL=1
MNKSLYERKLNSGGLCHSTNAVGVTSFRYWIPANTSFLGKRFNFKSKIDSFSPATEVQSGTDRATKCTFDIELQGYIIPNTIQKQINSQQTKTVSMAKVTIGSETVVSNLNTSE